jgi:cyclin H
VYRKALEFVRKSRMTDCEFIYTPSQIALAGVYAQSADVAIGWAVRKGLEEEVARRICTEIASAVERESKQLDVEQVREVDRRLRTCKNPERTAGSAVYESKKAAEVQRLSERKDEKLAHARQAMRENEDPFGGQLPPSPP